MATKKEKNKLKSFVKAGIIALIIVFLFKSFFVEVFIWQSSSMGNTLKPGDCIMVNKIKHGPRTPVTLLSLPFFEQSIYLKGIQLKPGRLKKKTKLKRNEVIAFNFHLQDSLPIDKREVIFSRLVALPGDTLILKEKTTVINGSFCPDVIELYHAYEIRYQSDSLLKDKNEYQAIDKMLQKYIVNIPKSKAEQLYQDENILEVTQICDKEGAGNPEIFPQSNMYYWNKDFFGPIFIPEKNTQMLIDSNNYMLYKRIITEETIKNPESFQMPGKYVFKNNYYFVLNDNRSNISDSRTFGFVPESHIIGNASFIWLNKTKKKKGFSRVFKKIY